MNKRVDRALFAFYGLVALIALAGQAQAAAKWLQWALPLAVAAVAAVEFGGIVLSVYGDHRRRLGERAYAARLLSAAVAAGAVLVNWVGHHDRLQGGFFAGMSALGYLVWLLHSGARRRDQLRADRKLPPVPPAYGLWQWMRRPVLTLRARALALADPGLGLYGSLNAAHERARIERRQAAIATLLRRKLTAGRDRLAGEIAVTVYDLDTIAARLAATADYDGLAALLAVDLEPARVAAAAPADATGHATGDAMAPDTDALPDTPRRTPPRRPTDTTQDRPAKDSPTAARVAKLRAKHHDITQAEAARRLKISQRTVSRHWAATAPPPDPASNGGPVPEDVVANSANMPAADPTAAAVPN